jgi:acylphosphatase
MAQPGADITVSVRIRGRVQGVWYRGWTEEEAARRGLRGWVRNRRDGSVEAMVQGSPDAIEAMTAWARRGPSSAVVADVRVAEGTGEYSGFETQPTE